MKQWGFTYKGFFEDDVTCFSGLFDSYEQMMEDIFSMAENSWDESIEIENHLVDEGEITFKDMRWTFGIRILKIEEMKLPAEDICNEWKKRTEEKHAERNKQRDLAELKRLKTKYEIRGKVIIYTLAEEVQLQALLKRREKNKKIVKVNNADLYVGSPIFYYCQSCDEAMSLPETHFCAAPKLCSHCKELVRDGLLVRTGTRSP